MQYLRGLSGKERNEVHIVVRTIVKMSNYFSVNFARLPGIKDDQ